MDNVKKVPNGQIQAADKAEGLQRALTKTFRDLFTNDAGQKAEPLRLKDVAGEYLDQEQIKILSEAVEKGVRPLPNES